MEKVDPLGDVPCGALSTTVNAFILEDIKKVTWRELRGRAEDVYECYDVLVKAKQACVCCIGELAGVQCHVFPSDDWGISFAEVGREGSRGASPKEDQLQLYAFAWMSDDVQTQSRILGGVSGFECVEVDDRKELGLHGERVESSLELLSSGEWNLERDEFSFNLVADAQSRRGGAEVGVPEGGVPMKKTIESVISAGSATLNSNQRRTKPNLLKLLFKALENRIHFELTRHSYIPLAQYSVYIKSSLDDPSEFYKMFHRELGLNAMRFKFFLCREGENFRIGLHAILVPTTLYPFPRNGADFGVSPLGLLSWSGRLGEGRPLIVMTAPTGLIGVLADASELDSPNVEFSAQNRRILEEWRERYHICDKSLVTILIGCVAYKFPRRCVFLVHPPYMSFFPEGGDRLRGGASRGGASSVGEVRRAMPGWVEVPRLDPFQYYQELFEQAFLDVAGLATRGPRPEGELALSRPFLLITELSRMVSSGGEEAGCTRKRGREVGGEELEGGEVSGKRSATRCVEMEGGDREEAKDGGGAAELSGMGKLPENMKMMGVSDFHASDRDGAELCDKDLSDWLELQSIDVVMEVPLVRECVGEGVSEESSGEGVESASGGRGVVQIEEDASCQEVGSLEGEEWSGDESHLSLSEELEGVYRQARGVSLPRWRWACEVRRGCEVGLSVSIRDFSYRPKSIYEDGERGEGAGVLSGLSVVSRRGEEVRGGEEESDSDSWSGSVEFGGLLGLDDPFCVRGVEPSAYLSVDWRGRSFAIRDFSVGVLSRVISGAPRNSAKLSVALNCYNYFNAQTGVFLANYVPTLYNNEVCMAREWSERAGGEVAAAFERDEGMLEVLVQEALSIYSPYAGELDQTDREDAMEVLRAYQHLDAVREQARLVDGGVCAAPLAANPAMTASVWLSSVDCSEGPMALQDWVSESECASGPLGSRRGKWSGSIESGGRVWAGSQWPAALGNQVAEYRYLLRRLAECVLPSALGGRARGPLTVEQFQGALAGGGREAGAECDVFDVPAMVVGYESNWLEISPTALYLWEKLNLRPYSPQKNVMYYAIVPHCVLEEAGIFFKQLSSVYEQCNLGCHLAGSGRELTDGILPCRLEPSEEKGEKKREEGEGEGDPFSIGTRQLRAYEDCSTQIGQFLAEGLGQSYGESVVIYVVNPYTVEPVVPPAAGETSSLQGVAGCAPGLGTTHVQRVSAHRSATVLVQRCLAAVRRVCSKCDRHVIVQGLSISRVLSPFAQVAPFKETAFNLFARCRRLYSQWDTASSPEGKLYEPLFVISHGHHASSLPNNELLDQLSVRRVDSPRPSPPAYHTLHVSYALTRHFLSYCFVDSNGELLEAGALSTMSDVTVALYRLWSTVVKLLPRTAYQWRVVFGKLGQLCPSEVKEWIDVVRNTSEEDRHRSKICQVALVSLSTSSSLRVVPDSRSSPPRVDLTFSDSENHSTSSVGVEGQFLASMFASSDKARRSLSSSDLAVYDYAPISFETLDDGGDVLARGFLIRSNPLWEHSSLFSQDVAQAYVVRLYRIFSFGDEPSLFYGAHASQDAVRNAIRTITKEYHRLSWLNLSPSGPKRSNSLPLNHKVVQGLSSLIQHTFSDDP